MLCPKCGAGMRPLLTSTYCPNDCDRSQDTPRTDDFIRNIAYSIHTIGSKMPAHQRKFFLETWRGTAKGDWYALRIASSWHIMRRPTGDPVHRADLILYVDKDGFLSVTKNRHGRLLLEDVPDCGD